MPVYFAEISYGQRKALDELLVQGGAVSVGGWKFNRMGAVKTSDDEILLCNVRDVTTESGKKSHKTVLTAKFPDMKKDVTKNNDAFDGKIPNNFDGFKPPSAN